MAIYVVADVHGSADALRKAIPEGSTLLLLGDLINFLDYTTMEGILTEVFSVEAVREVVELRTAGKVLEAREVMRKRSAGREDQIRAEIGTRMQQQYEEVFAAMTDPTYLILGNVDHPILARAHVDANDGVHAPDGRMVELEGERFGFVGGALPTPLNVPGEISEEEFRTKLDAIGDVDVLCTHIPPQVPDLCYDTVAHKHERGSADLLRYIEDVQPRRAYFGHIHQPLVSTMHIGRTLCINVGYFRTTQRPWPHQRDEEDSWRSA